MDEPNIMEDAFMAYSEKQRELIYAFQNTYGAVRVKPGKNGAVIVEGLDGTEARRVEERLVVDVDGLEVPDEDE